MKCVLSFSEYSLGQLVWFSPSLFAANAGLVVFVPSPTPIPMGPSAINSKGPPVKNVGGGIQESSPRRIFTLFLLCRLKSFTLVASCSLFVSRLPFRTFVLSFLSSFVRSYVRSLDRVVFLPFVRVLLRFFDPALERSFARSFCSSVRSFVCEFVGWFVRSFVGHLCFHFLWLKSDVNIVRHSRREIVKDIESIPKMFGKG